MTSDMRIVISHGFPLPVSLAVLEMALVSKAIWPYKDSFPFEAPVDERACVSLSISERVNDVPHNYVIIPLRTQFAAVGESISSVSCLRTFVKAPFKNGSIGIRFSALAFRHLVEKLAFISDAIDHELPICDAIMAPSSSISLPIGLYKAPKASLHSIQVVAFEDSSVVFHDSPQSVVVLFIIHSAVVCEVLTPDEFQRLELRDWVSFELVVPFEDLAVEQLELSVE
mmetsp:Transcript_15702/g.28654  ORF Transcript_15702/g.28654 Transcript_15702/m.28654 type:complete len:227 (-) Transcript_15702:66-746(-)